MGWEWCIRENSTYLDCPLSEYNDSTNIMVAVFNPATNGPTDYLSFPLKHGHYQVSAFDARSGKFSALNNTAVICDNETLPNGYEVRTCLMHLAYAVDSMQVGLV